MHRVCGVLHSDDSSSCFHAGCGDFDHLEPIELQDGDLKTSEHVSELRALTFDDLRLST